MTVSTAPTRIVQMEPIIRFTSNGLPGPTGLMKTALSYPLAILETITSRRFEAIFTQKPVATITSPLPRTILVNYGSARTRILPTPF